MKTENEIKVNVSQCLEHIDKLKEDSHEFLTKALKELLDEKLTEYIRGRFDHYEHEELKKTIELID